jgi:hypothetical protein
VAAERKTNDETIVRQGRWPSSARELVGVNSQGRSVTAARAAAEDRNRNACIEKKAEALWTTSQLDVAQLR